MYGEDRAAPSNIEGIPEMYEEELNKFYVAVRDSRPAEKLMDLNGDSVDELLIGTVASESEETTAFVAYSDPENPFATLTAVENQIYHLHAGEADGVFVAEIGGADAAWLLSAVEGESIMDINYREGAMGPAGRLPLEMIPFSQYK